MPNTRLLLIAVVIGAHLALVGFAGLPLWPGLLSAAAISAALWVLGAPRQVAPQQGRAQTAAAPLPGKAQICEAALASLPDPILVVDREGRITEANAALTALFTQARPGRLLSAVVRSPVVLDAVQRVLRGDPHAEVEFSQPPPEERFYRAFVLPVRGAEHSAFVMMVIHDVTTAKRVDRVRVDFIANASHELRSPLASLSGFIETLRGPAKDDPEAADRFLEIMEQQAERMRRLIDDLMSLSRIEIDEHVPPSDEVDVPALAAQVVDGLAPVAKQAGVEIFLETEPDLPKTIGTAHELSQVISNLIDNAIKYGRDGERVDVSVKLRTHQHGDGPARSFIKIAVQDYGEGIPHEDIPRLTERFYRVDPERSRKEGGTGLGLAIVKHIVNRHRGRLEIESEPGRGSTFTVLIPVIAESAPATAG